MLYLVVVVVVVVFVFEQCFEMNELEIFRPEARVVADRVCPRFLFRGLLERGLVRFVFRECHVDSIADCPTVDELVRSREELHRTYELGFERNRILI